MRIKEHTAKTHVALWATAWLVLMTGMAFGAPQTAEQDAAPSDSQEYGAGGGCCCCRSAEVADGSTGCGRRGAKAGMGRGRGQGGGGRGMGRSGESGRGSGPGGRPEMASIRELMHDYRQDIIRDIEDLANGVVTVTRSPDNPEAARALSKHVEEMKSLLESGGRIRAWDPLFREVFRHADEVDMVIEPLADGMRVIETSENPEVVKLIQAHARKVSDFLARGPEAAHEPTPLPSD